MRDYRFGFYALALCLAALVLLLNLRGPCLQTHTGHDSIGFLNGAWKVRCGVLPHADYRSALGALNPSLLAAGMWVLGPTDAVLPFCISLVAVAVGVLSFVVARPRLPALPALAFALTQTVVAGAPHLLRYPWDAATYDGYYNRQGYALLSVLLLLLLLPPGSGPARRERRDGLLAGGLLGVLLFLKISYFMAGGGLCALAFLFVRRSNLFWCVHVLAGWTVVFVACLPLIRFDVLALWHDLRMAAEVRAENRELAGQLGHFLAWRSNGWVEISLLGVTSLLLSPPLLFRRRPGVAPAAVLALWRREVPGSTHAQDPVPSWTEFVGVVAVSTFVCLTNASVDAASETPLLTSWLFVLLGALLRDPVRLRPGGAVLRMLGATPRLVAFCGFACVLWIYTMGGSLRCLVWSVSPWPTAWQQEALILSPPFEADSLQGLRMMLWAGEEHSLPLCYSQKVNDGLRLLRALGGTHRVEAFDFTNPFPFALQWPAAHGGAWCWHVGYSFDEAHHPSPEEAFGDADLLMVPRYPGHLASFLAMERVYGSYVLTHFKQICQSGQWVVLRRQ